MPIAPPVLGGDGGHRLADPLHGTGLYGLYGGVAVYLLAHVGVRLRTVRTVAVARAVVGLVLLALVPVADRLPALAALGLLTAVTVGLIAFEALRYAEARESVRNADGPDPHSAPDAATAAGSAVGTNTQAAT